jgi:hypothetical protein
MTVQPSSDGFPEGLLDQPFYGWVHARTEFREPALARLPNRLEPLAVVAEAMMEER